ncbi:hypothetical protein NCCP2222_07240 [Sporosarcina sp. NCCP-2222]|uniref:hypothetical protein n=1 Tax=Sporosarcina sp. NCCP-2222 TaxID=2935073 RepID=UPI0020851427|nr:hypothetical protein [Sporosarcina sp. NCCP-2222]GKV54777.1 hypothetical protein NCCP2222_07240 [Sporosarcina sp. NCCP-2222]
MKNIIRRASKGNTVGVVGTYCFLLLMAAGMAGCSEVPKSPEINSAYEQDFEIIGPEKDKLLGSVNPGVYKTADRTNRNAEPVSIPVVTKEGKEVELKTGRYMFTGYPTGNIFVYDEKGDLVLSEIVGSYTGSGSLTIDIQSGYTVRADGGYDSVEITPVPTALATDLTTGLWEVGQDIEPGKYEIAIDSKYGYLHVFEEGKEPRVFELIGGEIAKSDGVVTLEEGQMLRVTGTSLIRFTHTDS